MKVSVLLICYNQENYIQDAVESILMQKTDFEWELLIGDDASPDSTAQKIRESIQNPPENCTIRPFLREENVGASRNLFDLIRNAKGEYITVLEGDDYWLDETRLQTLADFLDEHPEYAGVSHKRERRQNGEFVKCDPNDELVGKPLTLKEYNNGNHFSAMACLFRNVYTTDTDGYEHLYTGARNACDQVMCYTILAAGDVFILDRVFGVYRIFSGGYCSSQSQMNRAKDYLVQNRRLLEYYNDAMIEQEITKLHSDVIKALLKIRIASATSYYFKIDKKEKKGVLKTTAKSILKKVSKGDKND